MSYFKDKNENKLLKKRNHIKNTLILLKQFDLVQFIYMYVKSDISC